MKKINKHISYGIIVILAMAIISLVLKYCHIEVKTIFLVVVISVIIEVGGFKLIVWLFKKSNPIIVVACTAISMIMIVPITFILWLMTYKYTDLSLIITVAITLLATGIAFLAIILLPIMAIIKKVKSKKNGH